MITIGVKFSFLLQLIQVAQHLENTSIRERELRSISDAGKSINVKSALILTDANENEININGLPVKIQSISEWMVTNS